MPSRNAASAPARSPSVLRSKPIAVAVAPKNDKPVTPPANASRSRHHPALPLYTREDAERAIEHLHPHPFGTPFEPAPGLRARFSPAGHILGAASVWLSDGDRSVSFSGDLGRRDDPIMLPPDPPVAADHFVIESTYGNRRHPDEDPADVLADVVVRTAKRGGIVLIPAFAVGRTQTVLHLLARLREQGRIPELPTFLNSPMAVEATEIFVRAEGGHRLSEHEIAQLRSGVELVRTVEESKQLTARRGPMIVLSASGMLTGGRVLHHLFQVAPDHRNTIVIAGFQAAGTRGETLVSGARTLRVFGEDVPVRAEVVSIDSLSAHADAEELMDWLAAAPHPPSAVSAVHGEPIASETLRRRICHELGWPASVPAVGDAIEVRPAAR